MCSKCTTEKKGKGGGGGGRGEDIYKNVQFRRNLYSCSFHSSLKGTNEI